MKWQGLLALLLTAGCQFCNRYTISHPGQNEVIQAQSGDRYHFTLEEDAATGDQWDYVCDDGDVEVMIDHWEASETEPGKASVWIRIHRGFDGPSSVKFSLRRPHVKKPVRQFILSLYKRTGDAAFWK